MSSIKKHVTDWFIPNYVEKQSPRQLFSLQIISPVIHLCLHILVIIFDIYIFFQFLAYQIYMYKKE